MLISTLQLCVSSKHAQQPEITLQKNHSFLVSVCLVYEEQSNYAFFSES